MNAWLAALSLAAVLAVATPSRIWASTITFDITSVPGSTGLFFGDSYSLGAGSSITINTSTGAVVSSDIVIDLSGVPVATFITATPASAPTWENSVPGYPAGFLWTNTQNSDVFGIAAANSNFFQNFNGCSSCEGGFFNGTSIILGDVSLTAAPEPGTIALLGVGLLALMLLKPRRQAGYLAPRASFHFV